MEKINLEITGADKEIQDAEIQISKLRQYIESIKQLQKTKVYLPDLDAKVTQIKEIEIASLKTGLKLDTPKKE